MADEREAILEKQIDDLDEQIKGLSEKLERVLGVDCSFGACVFDPEMKSIEDRLEEVRKRKETLEGILSHLESCDT